MGARDDFAGQVTPPELFPGKIGSRSRKSTQRDRETAQVAGDRPGPGRMNQPATLANSDMQASAMKHSP